MATITTALIQELREKTSAGMMDCKNALVENNGDISAAADWLVVTAVTAIYGNCNAHRAWA